MELKTATKVSIKSSPGMGLGVFATEDIYEGEVIEEAHMLDIPTEALELSPNLFEDYRFMYPHQREGKHTSLAVAFGYGSIYNHSDHPNVAWRDHPRYKAFVFYALKDIKKGEELLAYYGGDDYWNARKHINKI